jgi:flagellar biosynthetic protein FlhB
MAEQDLDRNEAASPYKLQKAREKGQVARSPEVGTAVALTVAVAWLYAKGWTGLAGLFRWDGGTLANAARTSPLTALAQVAGAACDMLTPFLLVVVVAAIVANLAQAGPVLSADPLLPDLTRLSPKAGLERVFSGRSVFELVKSLVKLAGLSTVAWLAWKALLPQFPRLGGLSVQGQARTLVEAVATLSARLLMVVALIAALDVVMVRRRFARTMRMSRREMKDENKHREGDPRIRARLRDLRRSWLLAPTEI